MNEILIGSGDALPPVRRLFGAKPRPETMTT